MPRKWVCCRTCRRRGAVAVAVAVLLIVLFGILALALDGGLFRDNHRKVQGAADAAALAAATELYCNFPAIAKSNYAVLDPGGTAAAAALASATANGFPNNGTTATVTVNIPPKSGPFTGTPTYGPVYAEVLITYYQGRAFSQLWGGTAIPVTARAVARGFWGGSNLGVIVLDPSGKASLNASGGAGLSVTGGTPGTPGAKVIVDSSDSQAGVVSGGGGITAAGFQITGGYSGTFNGPVQTGAPPSPDPLRYLPDPPVPAYGTMTTTNIGNGNKQYTLTPGRYTTLPNFNSGDVVILQQASANSAGGVYYLDGCGLTSTGANIVMYSSTAGGVMIYNNPSSSSNSQVINISGNSSGTVNISALTQGPYQGLLFWQNRAATQPMSITGNGNFTMIGTFYLANGTLTASGNGSAVIGSQYISQDLNLSGGGNIIINYTDSGTAPLREANLVE